MSVILNQMRYGGAAVIFIKESSKLELQLQCRSELSEQRTRIPHAAKTRVRVFLDSSKSAHFLHCYSSS